MGPGGRIVGLAHCPGRPPSTGILDQHQHLCLGDKAASHWCLASQSHHLDSSAPVPLEGSVTVPRARGPRPAARGHAQWAGRASPVGGPRPRALAYACADACRGWSNHTAAGQCAPGTAQPVRCDDYGYGVGRRGPSERHVFFRVSYIMCLSDRILVKGIE